MMEDTVEVDWKSITDISLLYSLCKYLQTPQGWKTQNDCSHSYQLLRLAAS